MGNMLCLCMAAAYGQTAYFVDGYHGGKWGHYPPQYTRFIVEQLQRHPDWKINLEIEPVTWTWVREVDKAGYAAFASYAANQTDEGRVEFVNPAYGQPYMYNLSGESIIRQLAYGMEELKAHFPSIKFSTYSSEEPCFTSALPQILRSFGFQYASLKNPNTCWGGYVRAHGNELLNWVGPDGTAIPTVPRYAMEALKPGSTWETIASTNSKDFIAGALAAGIKRPVGMCLQDAGWKNGPWLGANGGDYHPTEYTTWRHYFAGRNADRKLEDWRLSQEDIQVSLVWGAQVLQRIAQQVRQAENKLLMAEKWAAMDRAWYGTRWPDSALRQAWYPLLLAQHHDCWIVPYNQVDSLDWAGKVRQWTGTTEQTADAVLGKEAASENLPSTLIVRNVLPYKRDDLADYIFTGTDIDTTWVVVDAQGNVVPAQWSRKQDGQHLLFKANVPPMGESVFHLKKEKHHWPAFAQVSQEGAEWVIRTDKHTMRLNTHLGGVITSLRTNDRPEKELVDRQYNKGFNELRGFFYNERRFRSSTENPVSAKIVEQGPLRLKIAMKGEIAGHPFTQEIMLTKGEPRIDFQLEIDWHGQPQIGAFNDADLRLENRKKAFYDDRYKLLLLFPANLEQQRIAKNAPFDVTESRLNNTFFSSWDSIKNNVLLDWVDVTDGEQREGIALFSDHTTSYAHGEEHPLALTVQYVGKGLWGRDYRVDGPTRIHYSLLPHQGDWAKAQLWYANDALVNPLKVQRGNVRWSGKARSLLAFSKPGYALSSLQYDGGDMLLRIFNAAGDERPLGIHIGLPVVSAQLEDLNKTARENLTVEHKGGTAKVNVQMPRFGFRTVRIKMK